MTKKIKQRIGFGMIIIPVVIFVGCVIYVIGIPPLLLSIFGISLVITVWVSIAVHLIESG